MVRGQSNWELHVHVNDQIITGAFKLPGWVISMFFIITGS